MSAIIYSTLAAAIAVGVGSGSLPASKVTQPRSSVDMAQRKVISAYDAERGRLDRVALEEANALRAQGRFIEAARRMELRAGESRSYLKFAYHQFKIGELYELGGDHRSALKHYQFIMDPDRMDSGTSETMNQFVIMLRCAEKVGEAEAASVYDQISDMSDEEFGYVKFGSAFPALPKDLDKRARAHAKIAFGSWKDWSVAVKEMSKALELAPNQPILMYDLAVMHVRNNDPDRAAPLYDVVASMPKTGIDADSLHYLRTEIASRRAWIRQQQNGG